MINLVLWQSDILSFNAKSQFTQASVSRYWYAVGFSGEAYACVLVVSVLYSSGKFFRHTNTCFYLKKKHCKAKFTLT